MNKLYRILGMFTFCVAVLSMVACQDSSNDTGSQIGNAGKFGKVAIVLTDAPTDEFSEVNLTITQIALLRDDDQENDDNDNQDDDESSENSDNDSGNKVVIFEGEEVINLLALENYANLFALSTDVPAGTYQKIRLTLKKEGGIELVKRDENGEISEVHYPKIKGNAKLDLNARKPFEVVAGETLFIQLDIDAKKSIQIVKTGNGKYNFRPVVFIDVITPEFSGKLVRHSGYIHNLDLDNKRFNLCANAPAGDESNVTELCLLVHATDTALFDANGDSTSAENLADGQFITVIGYLQPYSNNNGAVVEYGQMLAQVIHIGDQNSFAEADGEVTSEVDQDIQKFALQLDANTAINVLLQADTRLFSRDGSVVSRDQIAVGRKLEVHGVYDTNDTTLLKSTLIIVEPLVAAQQQKLSGTVLETTADPASLMMATDNGDRKVLVSNETVILSVNTASQTSFSETATFESLAQNDRIEVYGVDNGMGEFLADIILVVAD